jgi:hypothetical protein
LRGFAKVVVQLYADSYLAILVFQKVFHYFLPAPSYVQYHY